MLFFYIVTVIFFYFAANYYYNDWKYVLFSHEIFGDGKNNQFSCAPPKKETLKEEIIKKISEKKEFQNCSKQEILEMATTLIKELENKRIIAYSAFKKFICAIICYSIILFGIIYVKEAGIFYIFSAQIMAGLFLISIYFKINLENELIELRKVLKIDRLAYANHSEVITHKIHSINKFEKKLRIVNPAYKFSGILFLILLAKILFF
ncbi:hypothetical protein A2331_02475 [Candidatus Falkowbacteria bacterium RIFOXYB2_FULL_34_18]|uniref:Uncharacterized protein n=1 Tax=Candidatus Falkowbacteria bacterium RIFOXYD2_FULL_34_120 TaxID=1798007 RepID=A0A1F5TR46_9BACT|nr:MAG: hypothetical protein A2331_02475 [Candidatus Falkowbacteria bacterium RIFOXYB2_FULL_34_18]OGF29489.1 MAG: hypothetical protein A2500_04325 [Candidatus Falkowbacteria bacterium RIFOXYC12_FULL_34_55]OGF36306.1 MAG: hypothetical protein A2466_05335 [Candidatus Falkowbacteria bacterium RIFOXYC2_FULL_34_220]OGF39015.1 MAG: hypothetical protein A2515_06790 [Candidatus Falkowbacteria bacterium RIFOXYD12_FULL_34_57]OGF41234.1 MAG: hypothetical protein A2531_01030 [Candidatus Falkowbacteria bact